MFPVSFSKSFPFNLVRKSMKKYQFGCASCNPGCLILYFIQFLFLILGTVVPENTSILG